MLRTAIKSLLGHKLRMLLTSFAIVLGVSFVSGTYIFTDSIGRTFDGLFSEVFRGVDLTVRPESSEFGDGRRTIDSDLLSDIAAVDGVQIAEPSADGYAQLISKDGEPIGGQGPPTLGFTWGGEPGLSPLVIEEGYGRAPAGPGEVVIDIATAETNDFALGDRVKIITSLPIEEFEIVGLAKFGSEDGLAGATLSLFEINEAQRLFNLGDSYSEIAIKYSNGADAEATKAGVEAVLPSGLEVVTGEEQTNEAIDEISEGLGFINTALLAFAGVSIFVGAYIIQNTFRIIVTQRSKELALLRAIGATKRQVVLLVAYEALIVAIIASLMGVALGVFIAEGVRAMMNAFGATLPDGSFSLLPRTVVVSMLVGVVVTMVSAILPAIKASSVPPVAAMKDMGSIGSTSSIPSTKGWLGYLVSIVSGGSLTYTAAGLKRSNVFRRSLVAYIVTILGAILLVVGLNREGLSNPVYYVGAGALVMFIGVTLLAPVLAGPIAVIVGWPLSKLRGMAGRLGMQNVRRDPARTASSAAALMIGVSLVVFVSILASSFKSTIDTVITENFPADLVFTSENRGDGGPGSAGFSTLLVDDLKALDELEDVSAVRYRFDGARIGDDTIFVAGIDPDTFGRSFLLKPTQDAYEQLGLDGIVIHQGQLETRGWSIGDYIDIEFPIIGESQIKVVGSFEEAFDTDYIISNELLLSTTEFDSVTLATARYADGVSAGDAKNASQAVVDRYGAVEVLNQTELVDQARTQIDQILGLLWSLLGFAVIIAILGITNTLALSISERTKEIGMLRAIGMTRPQVRTMVRVESIIIAMFGALLGVVLGIFFGWALIEALESEGIEDFVVPTGQIIGYFVLAAIAGILAAAGPAWRASRMNVLDAISHE